MSRRGLSDQERLQRAIGASRRMILSGDPPTFALRPVVDGYLVVAFDLLVDAMSPAEAVDRAALLLAELLDVDPTQVKVKLEGA